MRKKTLPALPFGKPNRFQSSTQNLAETWHVTGSKRSHAVRKHNSSAVLLSRSPSPRPHLPAGFPAQPPAPGRAAGPSPPGPRLSSTHTFSRTIPLACEAPPKGLAFSAVPRWAFLYCLSCHFWSRRWLRSFRAVRRPRHFPAEQSRRGMRGRPFPPPYTPPRASQGGAQRRAATPALRGEGVQPGPAASLPSG